MKILHIIYDDVDNPWCGGGGAQRALKINERLAGSNRIRVLTGNFPGARNRVENGVEYIRVGMPFSYVISRISFTALAPFYMRRIKSDIVVNDCSYFAPVFPNLLSQRPCVSIVHHLMGRHAFRLYPVLGVIPFLAEKLLVRTASNIITPSQHVKHALQQRYDGRSVDAVPNGISKDLFLLDPEEKPFVLFLGRVDIYMKGIDILLEAFARLKHDSVTLKIAGSGKPGDVRELKNMIRRHHLEKRVEVLGRVSEAVKRELLRTCLFLALPSRFEGWGIVAVEAGAVGKAVLCTRVEGLYEATGGGRSALLVEPENTAALAAGMAELVNDREMRRRLGGAGRDLARRFTWESVSKDQARIYASVAQKKHPAGFRFKGEHLNR